MIRYEVRANDDGSEYWYPDGLKHRVGGPAITYPDGRECWYHNGKCHREDGPAIERADGGRYYYLNGILLSPEEFLEQTPRQVDALFNLS